MKTLAQEEDKTFNKFIIWPLISNFLQDKRKQLIS